jgi:TolC family type I secretion outer membrane protein
MKVTIRRYGLRALLFGVAAFAPLAARALTLGEAAQLALAHDPSMAVAQAGYEADREAGPQTTSVLKPNVSLAANAARNRTKVESKFFGAFDERYPSTSAAATLRQAVFRYDWFARVRRANALRSAAESTLNDQRAGILLDVAQRYFAVMRARDDLGFAAAEARANTETWADTRKRHDAGLVPGTDLKEAQARKDLADARVIGARLGVANAVDGLKQSTGYDGAPLPALGADLPLRVPEPASPDQWVTAALESNPGIRALREQAAAFRDDVKLRRAEALPTLDLVGEYFRDDTSDFAIGQKRTGGDAKVELKVPLYGGGYNLSRVREGKALSRRAAAEFARAVSNSDREVRQAYREVETSLAQVAAFEQSLQSALAAEQATKNGYDAGTRTITDVLNARTTVTDTRRQLQGARYDYVLALFQLKRLAGQLTETDLAAFDSYLTTAAPNPEEFNP